MALPSVEQVNDARVGKFLGRIADTLARESAGAGELGFFRELIERYEREHDVPAVEIAAALAKLLQGDAPLLLAPERKRERAEPPRPDRMPSAVRDDASPPRRKDIAPRAAPEPGMETYRIEVGRIHGVKPANIVGAIANEAELDSRYIGRIDIHDDHSILDLPEGMPRPLLMHLKKVRVSGQMLRLHRLDETDVDGGTGAAHRHAAKSHKPAAHTSKPHETKPHASKQHASKAHLPKSHAPKPRAPKPSRDGKTSHKGPRKGPRKG